MPLTASGCEIIASRIVADATIPPFNNANAYLGIGDSPVPYQRLQTDLQGVNKVRKGMEADYPKRDGAVIRFRALFDTNQANFAWREWGLFHASSGGSMLNRKVRLLGTKLDTESWYLFVSISIQIGD